MATTPDINQILQTLHEAQANKDLVAALTTSLEKYIQTQQSGLEELESILNKAKTGELKVKKRGGYRGRKAKAADGHGEIGNGATDNNQ